VKHARTYLHYHNPFYCNCTQQFKIQGVRSAAATVGGKRIGSVRIKSFSSSTAEDVAAALKQLKAAGQLHGVVLDLRGNVGGLLPGGVDTAREFLTAQKDIVFVIGKTGVVAAQGTGAEAGAFTEVSVPLLLLLLLLLLHES
jgi:C-terminal processing protease CtpA/Prc